MKLTLSRSIDVPFLLVLFLIGFAGSYIGAGKINPHGARAANVWFQADIERVYGNMTKRWSDHYRTKVHPLFSLAAHPAVHVLHKAGLQKYEAVRLFVGTTAGMWLATIFLLLRLLRLRYLDAMLFSTLAAVSASAFFWSTVPETYLIGSVTMLLVMGFVAVSSERTFSAIWYVAFSAISLSMTVTNWMTGILATIVNNSWKQSIRITLDAFLLVTVLWAVQHAIYPSSEFFLLSPEEHLYILPDTGGGFIEKTVAFFLHSMIMPEIQALENPWAADWPFLTIQLASIGSSGFLGLAMTVIWAGLLGFGAWAAFRFPEQEKFKVVLGLTLLGQLGLHLLYGDETFLYSLHWLPFLVLLAAMGAVSPHRRYVLAAVAVLIVGAGFNNFQQFTKATVELNSEKYSGSKSERARLLSTIKEHPDADWPRGEGHVLLAIAGSPLHAKGYHEPGGSFSPGFGSFGISFAFFDPEGKLAFSSNTIPLDDISQKLHPDSNSILTSTSHYSAEWRASGENRWSLRFITRSSESKAPALRISSAGPSGAPIKRLQWDDHRLIVNDQYTIELNRMPDRVFFLDERNSPSLSSGTNNGMWEPDDGYGSVLLLLEQGVEYVVDVVAKAEPNHKVHSSQPESVLEIDFPDKRFADSLLAQIFHLKAGLVGDETRPGDPGNYDVNWLRDGAYVMVALARAGELQLAKKLAGPFATQDYFGGFGAEADAPGLAIWALEEISVRLRRPEYDQWVWPHVLRKTDLILEMLDADSTIYKDFSGPIVPSLRNKKYSELSEVANPAKDGLIYGKMDNHRPIFYVNATAYMGLTHAAALAERLGFRDKAIQLQNRAHELRDDWEQALETHPDRNNSRTLIVGLYPSNIIQNRQELYRRLLEKHWLKNRTEDGDFVSFPLWTYFDVAEAHQWVFLGEPQRAWSTLDWFWRHQVSPGLYTWWEGKGEENSFHIWETVRGWHEPQHVTPHYWTAAEIALLQLDMLACEMNEEKELTIVIGAGVPSDWLDQSFSVRGLSLRNGILDWNWDGTQITAVWHGKQTPRLVAGAAFPESTLVKMTLNSFQRKSNKSH